MFDIVVFLGVYVRHSILKFAHFNKIVAATPFINVATTT